VPHTGVRSLQGARKEGVFFSEEKNQKTFDFALAATLFFYSSSEKLFLLFVCTHRVAPQA
jgi:hypothetical protein